MKKLAMLATISLIALASLSLTGCIQAHSDTVIEKDGSGWIRTTVTDAGPGVSEDVRERMFDPFFTTKPRDKGTGLGLSISHGIVKDHGGELTVESQIGEWTRVHLDLPVDNGWDTRDSATGAG